MTVTDITAGSIVQARPWIGGYEQDEVSGYVINADPAEAGPEYVIVWFPGMSADLGREHIGRGVQPILKNKLARPAGRLQHVSGMPGAQIRRLLAIVQAEEGRAVIAPFYQALCNAARAKGIRK